MLAEYLSSFNEALAQFQTKFPRDKWTKPFKDSLINDYTFFSSRIEDPKLQYGDTIRFLNDETVRGVNLVSLSGVSDHQAVLKELLDHLNDFSLSEERIKSIHASLMGAPMAWEVEYKQELVGEYRKSPSIGSRRPYFEDKQYLPAANLEIAMASWMDLLAQELQDIDNTLTEKHLLTRIASFHNKFLNYIHPFADGNGRVCRIVIGGILMSQNCPPIFPQIKTHEEQVEYISTIVACEQQGTNEPLVKYFAEGMTDYLNARLRAE